MKRRTLPPRQKQVLLLVAGGHTSTRIGQMVGISGLTVSHHLTEAYRFLGAQDRAHAVALAIWHGHITLDELATVVGGSSSRVTEAPQEPVDGPRGAREPARAARDVRGATDASAGRTAPRGASGSGREPHTTPPTVTAPHTEAAA